MFDPVIYDPYIDSALSRQFDHIFFTIFLSADNHLVQWDVRKQPAVVQSIKAHQDEVIAVDWNKYDQVNVLKVREKILHKELC